MQPVHPGHILKCARLVLPRNDIKATIILSIIYQECRRDPNLFGPSP